MAKIQILKINEKKDLRKVPKKYANLVGSYQLGKVLIFVDGRNHSVVTSKEVIKLLKKIDLEESENYIVMSENISQEAMDLLTENGIDFVLERDNFIWTDDSYNQRQKRRHEFLDELNKKGLKSSGVKT
ncbi:MAG: hypothetical protein AAF620_12620 [Bacteroidota bacterium]